MPFEQLRKQQPELWEKNRDMFEETALSTAPSLTLRPQQKSAEHAPIPVIVPPGTRYERNSPCRKPTFTNDVAVPFFRALIPGSLSLVAVISIGYLLEIDAGITWPVGGIIAPLVAMAWYIHNHSYDTELLWNMETVTGVDINHDGRIGNPASRTLPTIEAMALTPRDDSQFYWKDRAWAQEQRIEWGMIESFITSASGDNGRLTLERADDAGLTRDEWDRIVMFLTRTGLATPKRQGVDAKLRQDVTDTLNKLLAVEDL